MKFKFKNIIKREKRKEKRNVFMPGTSDVIFKSIMLDKETSDYLKLLIHLIAEIPFELLEKITIRNIEHLIKNKKDKHMKSDIIVSFGKIFISVEMNPKLWNGLFNRNDNYMQKIASNFYNKKESYLSEYRILQINFDCFNYLHEEKEVSKLVYKELDTNELDPNYKFSIKYHVNLEYIQKICYNRPVNELSQLERCCMLLMAKTKEEAEMYAGEDLVMKKVSKKLEDLSSDEKVIGLYDAELEAEKIYMTRMESAKIEGREEGIAEGRAKGREEGINQRNIEIAKNLLQLNTDIETISKATGLSVEQIEKLND